MIKAKQDQEFSRYTESFPVSSDRVGCVVLLIRNFDCNEKINQIDILNLWKLFQWITESSCAARFNSIEIEMSLISMLDWVSEKFYLFSRTRSRKLAELILNICQFYFIIMQISCTMCIFVVFQILSLKLDKHTVVK